MLPPEAYNQQLDPFLKLSHPFENKENNLSKVNGITETQNSSGWKGPLEVIFAESKATSDLVAGLCPVEF